MSTEVKKNSNFIPCDGKNAEVSGGSAAWRPAPASDMSAAGFSDLVDTPLTPLSADAESPLSSIFVQPGFDVAKAQGITRQFLEDADTYHSLYYQPDNTRTLLQMAFKEIGKEYINPCIFDIGSGSGNTVFACAGLFDECRIIATDLSPHMLAILRNIQRKTFPDVPVHCWAVDALDLSIKPDSFDLFLGSAILHHLIHPEKAVTCAYRTLKHGGTAIFVEPFLSGHVVALSLYQTLLRMDEKYVADKLPPPVRQALEKQIAGWLIRMRQCEAPDENTVGELDDKWIFSEKMISCMAESSGFDRVTYIPIPHHSRYKAELHMLLTYYALHAIPLPEWVSDIVAAFDDSDMLQQENDIMLSKIIVMQK